MKQISIAHSPDTDDLFLFWALREKLISTPGYHWTFQALDTEELNEAARNEIFDVTAISVAAYPGARSAYLILPHGASVGRNYGPVVLACQKFSLDELNALRIGVPGKTTTAALLLQKLAPEATTVEVPLTPYGTVFEKLSSGELDAAVVIHEGQISFSQESFTPIVNLGRWWNEQTGLPLPVGINVIHQRLGDSDIEAVSEILRRSIRFALDHKEEILPSLFAHSQAQGAKLKNIDQLSEYLSLYANEDSYSLAEDCRTAIQQLVGDEIRYAP